MFVCKSGNLLFCFESETVSQLFLKSIQHLSSGIDVTISDENIVIVWVKHIFVSKFFAHHIQFILRTHKDRDKNRILSILAVTYRYLHGQKSTK